MLDKAVNKINKEMESNNKSNYIQIVGTMLLGYLKSNPDAAEKILQTDKSIKKSLEKMRKVAESKKEGTCAVLTDQEGFDIVLKYFDVEGVSTPLAYKPVQVPNEAASDFNVSLEDLLL